MTRAIAMAALLCGLVLAQACASNGGPVAVADALPDTSRDGSPATDSASATLDFAKIGKPVLISQQFQFAEGPVWNKKAGVLLFSDINGDTIYQLNPPGTITALRSPSNNANGLALDIQGLLLAAEHGSRSVTRTLANGSVSTLAASIGGKKLNSPNDITVRSDGIIYFTDPTFGLKGQKAELDYMGLYRVTPAGTLTLQAKIDGSPNGLGLSPDEKTLYVAVTFKDQILAFSVAADGSLDNQRLFAQVTQPDGMALDLGGNLYVASKDSSPAVVVLSAQGKRLGAIPISHGPTNCGFGGSDGKVLFITARKALYKVAVPLAGR